MSGSGPFYAEGWYSVEGIDAALGESKNGHPMVTIKVLPIASVSAYVDAAGIEQRQETRVQKSYERTTRIVLKVDDEQSQEFALMKLRQAGWQGDSFRELAGLRGLRFDMSCKHEPGTGDYAGRMFERWEMPLPRRDSEPLENDDKLARKLDALFGKKLKTNGTSKPATATAPPLPDGTDVLDDDIPF
jgi:hypothetical protein